MPQANGLLSAVSSALVAEHEMYRIACQIIVALFAFKRAKFQDLDADV
jgi:hypothetical protein